MKKRTTKRGVKKMKKQAHKIRQKHVMDMLLARKDGPMHTRTKDIRRGSSRKAKHKNNDEC